MMTITQLIEYWVCNKRYSSLLITVSCYSIIYIQGWDILY